MREGREGASIGAVLVLGTLMLVVNAGMWYALKVGQSPARAQDPSALREVASKLSSVGVKGEAARYYAHYLERADIPDLTRAKVGMALARLLKEDGRLEESLGYLYRVEAWAPSSDSAQDAAPMIVEILERLGKSQAAQTALSRRSSLDRPEPSSSTDTPIVAQIGSKSVTTADLDRAIEALPPKLQERVRTPEGKKEFLKQFVAQELLYDKALKRSLETDPQVRRQIDAVTRQVIINRMIEEEMQSKVRADESDLRNFYEAHRDELSSGDEEPPPFEEVKDKVLEAYVMEKAQTLTLELLREAQAAQEVKLFPEALTEKSGGTP